MRTASKLIGEASSNNFLGLFLLSVSHKQKEGPLGGLTTGSSLCVCDDVTKLNNSNNTPVALWKQSESKTTETHNILL